MSRRMVAIALAAAAAALVAAATNGAAAFWAPAAPGSPAQTSELDFGDAPDGTSARYAKRPRVTGRFPSRARSGGPRHPSTGPRIGTGWSAEPDSRQVDADADDGASLNPRSCAPSTLSVLVDATRADPGTPIYLNAWFDWNQDGDWADGGTPRCRPEWAIQNHLVRPESLGADRIAMLTLRFRAGRVPDQFWWRVQVHSGDPVPHLGGGGQTSPTRGGETEDRLFSRLPGVRRPSPTLICQVGGTPANDTVYPHGPGPDFLFGFVGVRDTDRLSARSVRYRVRGDTDGIVVRRVPHREAPHRVWALRLSSREHERDRVEQKVRIEFSVVALLNGQLQRRYDAPCSVTIFHARRAAPPVQPPRDYTPVTAGGVEVLIGSPRIGFTYDAATGEFTARPLISFVNAGRVSLPAGARLEATASRAVTFSGIVCTPPVPAGGCWRTGYRGHALACSQTSATAWSCPLPELRPQVTHTWDIAARTRERGQLRLTFAVPLPRSLDPTPNAPIQVPIPIP